MHRLVLERSSSATAISVRQADKRAATGAGQAVDPRWVEIRGVDKVPGRGPWPKLFQKQANFAKLRGYLRSEGSWRT